MTADRNFLGDLHTKLAEAFKKKLESDGCTAAEMNVIRQFLKDNNISGIPVEGSPLKDIVDGLPLTEEEQEFIKSVKAK